MHEDLSVDIRYADVDLPLQPPFKKRLPTKLKHDQLSPLFDMLEEYVQPGFIESKEPLGIYRYWHIFLLMQLLFYVITLVIFLICMDFYDLKIFILKYPLVYVICCCFFGLALISLHYKPNIVKRFPYNYIVFIFTIVPGIYIAVFIAMYFRDYYPDTYLFNLIIIHVMFYIKYQASVQEYFTLSLLNGQAEQNDQENSEQEQNQSNQNKKQILSEEEIPEHKNLQNEDKLSQPSQGQKSQPSQGQKSQPSQGQKSSIISGSHKNIQSGKQSQQGEEKKPSKRQSLEVEQKEIGQQQLENEQEQLIIKDENENVQDLTFWNIEEVIRQKTKYMPNEKFVLHENWMFILICSFLLPIITLRNFDNYLTLFEYLIYGMFNMIYVCIVFFHLKIYELESRLFILHYSWANGYYLCLSYWFSDFLWPPFLLSSLGRLGDQIFRKMQQENELPKQEQNQEEVIELIPQDDEVQYQEDNEEQQEKSFIQEEIYKEEEQKQEYAQQNNEQIFSDEQLNSSSQD